MSSMHPPIDDSNRTASASWRGSIRIALLMVAAIGAFYLLREHWNHVAGLWVYLLLLACPLMHLFHGHGGHGHGSGHDAPDERVGERDRSRP